MSNIAVSMRRIKSKKGVVILPLAEYEALLRDAAGVLVEYLPPKAAAKLDKVVKKAMEDYKAGKTKMLSSFADLRRK